MKTCNKCGGYFHKSDTKKFASKVYCSICYNELSISCDKCGSDNHVDSIENENRILYFCDKCNGFLKAEHV